MFNKKAKEMHRPETYPSKPTPTDFFHSSYIAFIRVSYIPIMAGLLP